MYSLKISNKPSGLNSVEPAASYFTKLALMAAVAGTGAKVVRLNLEAPVDYRAPGTSSA